MKKLLLILLFVSCKKFSADSLPSITKHVNQTFSYSVIKNVQPIPDSNYEAFSVPIENKPDTEVTVYYSHAISHTTGGKLVYRTINELTGVVSNYTVIRSDSLHINGATGGKMGNHSTVLFYTEIHSDGSRDIYIIKCDRNNNFSEPVPFDWTGILKLQGGFFFGKLIDGDVCGEQYHILYQVGAGRYRASIIKTNDYWRTYHEIGVLYDGPITYTEFSGANLGGGKLLALARNNVSGSLTPFESVNYGATWLRRPTCNLYWWNGGGVEMAWITPHDGVFDIFYECRDASMMQISKGNTLANFGNTYPFYNPPEVYMYHRGIGGNPSLGYGQELKLHSGIFLTIFSKEYTTKKANLQWTFDDLTTDPQGTPISPTLTISGITTTSFRYDITNYGDWQNIRYLSMDLSTDSTFSSFVTAKYRSISAYPAVPINNIRVTGYWDIFNGLVTGTTYWLRLTAINNTCSASPLIVKVKTL